MVAGHSRIDVFIRTDPPILSGASLSGSIFYDKVEAPLSKEQEMIEVAKAYRIVQSKIKTLEPETVKLTDSLGRVLAEDVYANTDIPAADNTAMDGYALKAAATRGATRNSPKIFQVVENLRAGYVAKKTLRTGEAARIMTGALIPKGADSVVIVEETQRLAEDKVKVFQEVRTGENIRRRGEDISRHELVINKGRLLTAADIGLLASLGRPQVKVTRRPRVAILATGDEIVDVHTPLEAGKVRSSNTYTLYSQVVTCGGIPKNLGIARDQVESLKKKIRRGLDYDILLTSGGVSVGDYDVVKFALAQMGTKIRFWRVAMKPGKPLVFGQIKGKPIFGLPGNPVSSMINFELFVRPVILKMLGQKSDTRKQVDAVLEVAIRKRKGLRYYIRAVSRWARGKYYTRPTGPQGSGILNSMALANSLIVLPEADEYLEKGRRVQVKFLE